MSEIRDRAIAGLKPGDSFTVTRIFTREDTHAFADITGDYNPIHFDRRFTEVKGFAGPCCHGLLTGSLLSQIGGQIGWLASGMEFRFRKPVYFGDTVTCRLTIAELDGRGRAKAEAVFTNQEGTLVAEGKLYGVVPGPREREVMAAMRAEGDPTNKLR